MGCSGEAEDVAAAGVPPICCSDTAGACCGISAAGACTAMKVSGSYTCGRQRPAPRFRKAVPLPNHASLSAALAAVPAALFPHPARALPQACRTAPGEQIDRLAEQSMEEHLDGAGMCLRWQRAVMLRGPPTG